MKSRLLTTVLLTVVITSSDARLRSLSLDMQANMFYTHYWLGYEESAFDPEWLKHKLTCHFDETNDECANVAALLGMLYFLTPRDEGLAYAKKIEPLLRHDEFLHLEVAMLLYMYGDHSFVEELDEEFIEDFDLPHIAPYQQDHALKLLRSNDSTEVADGVTYVRSYHEQLPRPSAAIEAIKSIYVNSDQPHGFIESFLTDFYYLFNAQEDGQDTHDFGRLTVSSFVIDRANYLKKHDISSVWKTHAKAMPLEEPCAEWAYDTELEHFFANYAYRPTPGPEDEKKIKLMLKTEAYKQSSASFQIRAAEYLARTFPDISRKMLKKTHQQATPLIQSSLMVMHPDLFPSNQRRWDDMIKRSSGIDQVLIMTNRKQFSADQ